VTAAADRITKETRPANLTMITDVELFIDSKEWYEVQQNYAYIIEGFYEKQQK
jgi:hypothetical protein